MADPLIMGECHCDPECQHIRHVTDTRGEPRGWCVRKEPQVELEWYDYYLAECLNDEPTESEPNK
jgi:hypothetical protein